MKAIFVYLSIAATALLIFSCSKNDKDEDLPPIVGYWQGKYQFGPLVPTALWSMVFRKNGTCRYFDAWDTTMATKGNGVYSVNGNTVYMNITYEMGTATTSFAGTADAGFTRIDGTWGSGTSTSDGGLMYLEKK